MTKTLRTRYLILIACFAILVFTPYPASTGGNFQASNLNPIIYLQTVFKPQHPSALAWPIGCIPGEACEGGIGYPDIDGDGRAFNCGPPQYSGHQGTDIRTSWEQMDSGMNVYAAEDGRVQWVFDGKYDRCPDGSQPDCQAPPAGWFSPGESNGYRVCTELGPYCGSGTGSCFWCFDGGNVVVIRHTNSQGLFATRYDHFKRNSILVQPGDLVTQGQIIGQVGSAGNSRQPHLHFEVWGSGYYQLADPWAGECGPNFSQPMWKFQPPWSGGSPQ